MVLDICQRPYRGRSNSSHCQHLARQPALSVVIALFSEHASKLYPAPCYNARMSEQAKPESCGAHARLIEIRREIDAILAGAEITEDQKRLVVALIGESLDVGEHIVTHHDRP